MLFKPRSLKEKVKEIVSGFWKSEFTFLLFIGTYVWKLIKFVNDKIIRLFIHNLLIYIYIITKYNAIKYSGRTLELRF